MAAKPKSSSGKAIPVHVPNCEMLDPAKLTLHDKNPNTHGERQLVLYAKIIRAHGWRRAVVVSKRSMMVTKGNGAVQAALAHGLGKVPVQYQPYKSKAEELADMAADNELARMAENDEEALNALLDELKADGYDTELAGQLAELEEEFQSDGDDGPQPQNVFKVLVTCKSQADQKRLCTKLRGMGYGCEAQIGHE